MTARFPLTWPAGWPRTPIADRVDARSRWSHKRPGSDKPQPWTFDAARRALGDELELIGAQEIILSTNYDLRLDGQPRAGAKPPADQGVAVYFKLDGRDVAMARDAFVGAPENLRSLSLAVRAMRSLEEHGGRMMMDKAFEGFAALPAPKRWWETMGVREDASIGEIHSEFRRRSMELHRAGKGGGAEQADLNVARDEGLRARREST